MESPTSTFALLEKAHARDRAALSLAFEKQQRRLAVLVHFKLSDRSHECMRHDGYCAFILAWFLRNATAAESHLPR
jgi:hypothetical protein